METHCRAMGRHLPYGITQCCLPPDTGELAAPKFLNTAGQAGTQFAYLRGMEG